jgi:hypothetical protein
VPPGGGLPPIDDLARHLWAKGVLPPSLVLTIEAWLGTGSAGAFQRAFSELARGLYEHGDLNDVDFEALLSPDGVRRIPYIPEPARAQLKEQLRREILEQMKRESWAAPGAFAEWTKRLKFSGDVRTRFERAWFPVGNDSQNNFDYAAVNASSTGLDVTFVDATSERYYNVDQSRSRPRVRGRLGVDADVAPGVTAAFKLATGDNASPVSTNQTLGGASGGFAKGAIWLDRLYVRGVLGQPEGPTLSAVAGRFENPFLSTELVWDEDVSFEGIAGRVTTRMGNATLFLTGGAFPIYTTPLDLSVDKQRKVPSRDRWLYGWQGGIELRGGDRFGVRLGVGYYDFDHAQGRTSSPCDTHVKGASCDTDGTRPTFAQKGNTYFPLRTPSPLALLAEAGGGSEYQYFGLASRFQEVVGTVRAQATFSPVTLFLDGEFAWNVGFSSAVAARRAVNNFKGGTCDAGGCAYGGGDKGLLLRIAAGTRTVRKLGDWNVSVGYRYLETDAVLDAYTDSDFGLGGTNLKGFLVTGSLGLADGVATSVRMYSADQIVGSPYAVDVLQLDVTARF